MNDTPKRRRMHENSLKNLTTGIRPGRPRKPHKLQLIVRLEAADLEHLKRVALENNATVSEHAREIILEALKR